MLYSLVPVLVSGVGIFGFLVSATHTSSFSSVTSYCNISATKNPINFVLTPLDPHHDGLREYLFSTWGMSRGEGGKSHFPFRRIFRNSRFPTFLASGVSHPPTSSVSQREVSHTGTARRTADHLGTGAYDTNAGRAISGDCGN